jgi:hypothetical protein
MAHVERLINVQWVNIPAIITLDRSNSLSLAETLRNLLKYDLGWSSMTKGIPKLS